MPLKDEKARRNYNSEYNKKWYSKNKKKKKEQAKKSRKRAVHRNRKYVERDKLANPCLCGEVQCCCLSYHHYDGNKEGNISDMVNRGYSIKRIQTEIDKCKIMCLNCHAKLHNQEKLELAVKTRAEAKAKDKAVKKEMVKNVS